MKIAVAIATAGRPDLLPKVIDTFKRQTRSADAIYVCPASDVDYDSASNVDLGIPVFVVRGPKGLPAQRNTIIRAAADVDVLAFFDDDFVADANFLCEVERIFEHQPGVLIATGDVVADGINGPGLSLDEAERVISALPGLPQEQVSEVFNAYGCNMVVRIKAATANNILFDEVLPLYGWWEDVDFSRRLAPFGKIIKSNRLRGVHMGSKSGRTPGQKLGYSQVANIIYMIQKGSVPVSVGLIRIGRNVFANMVRQFKPEPWADRKGRFKGNLIAIKDCLLAPADPQRALNL
jgi:GT2 family glycosyltransferase